MNNEIIDFLRDKEEYTSGEELSSIFKFSRQALWKHIEALREAGYEIIAVPHLGYKLVSCPDRLFALEVEHGLKTNFVGRKIYYFDSIYSTMDMAMDLGMKGAVEGTLILSETQTRGRGRMGREWSSPKFKGIYLSLILKPEIPPGKLPLLTLLTAVSICEAVNEATGLEPKIKWPNDIFINNKKLGGILTELSAEIDRVRFVVVGVGLNVNTEKKSLVPGATSLKEEKLQPINRVLILQETLRRIEENYLKFRVKGADTVIEKWKNYNITLGRRVRVDFFDRKLEGQAADIDSDGALLIRKDSGITQKITAGDIVHCR